eukprot:COSAG01_NODE_529_length_15890_cov_548.099994_5_plen_78_part_00
MRRAPLGRPPPAIRRGVVSDSRPHGEVGRPAAPTGSQVEPAASWLVLVAAKVLLVGGPGWWPLLLQLHPTGSSHLRT